MISPQCDSVTTQGGSGASLDMEGMAPGGSPPAPEFPIQAVLLANWCGVKARIISIPPPIRVKNTIGHFYCQLNLFLDIIYYTFIDGQITEHLTCTYRMDSVLEKPSFGEWLLKALDDRGMRQAELARAVDTHRSAISQLINNRMSLSADMRERIARVLRIPQDEIPPTTTIASSSGTVGTSGSMGRVPSVSSYFASEDEPRETILRFIDNSIPDHLLPRLAEKMGYFDPFNIKLKIEKLDKKDYSTAQHHSLDRPLVSGDFTLQCGPWDSYHRGQRTFLARVNRYTGYALITNAGTRLPSVCEASDPEGKKAAFRELMERIFARGAEKNVAFLDAPARHFYEILLELHGDLEGKKGGLTVELPEPSGLAALEALDEIGRSRADFAVGHANHVALARSESPRYKLLVEYSDVEEIIDVVKDSTVIVPRLEASRKFNPPSRSKRQDVDGRSSGYEKFKNHYAKKLREVTLDNVWSLNIDYSRVEEDPSFQALVCRLAGVAYRTVQLLQDPDKQQAALRTILDFTKEGRDRRASEGSRFKSITAEYFERVWNKSYQMTSFEETWIWINGREHGNSEMNSSAEMKKKLAQLKSVMGWMAERKAEYEFIRDEIVDAKMQMSATTEEHLRRAAHHYSIFNYWDAVSYADRARGTMPTIKPPEEQSHARSRGN